MVRRLPPGMLRERATRVQARRWQGSRRDASASARGAAPSRSRRRGTVADGARRRTRRRSRPRATRSTASLASLGGTGVFAKALRDALLAGEIDVVVHSFKDLPTAPQPGLVDRRRPQARRRRATRSAPATGSRSRRCPRAPASARARRVGARSSPPGGPTSSVVDIRGNVDTRLSRRRSSRASERLDAVVLAAAGLEPPRASGRGDRAPRASTAGRRRPAQGALAVEIRAGDEQLRVAHRPQDVAHWPPRPSAASSRGSRRGARRRSAPHAFVEDGMLFLTRARLSARRAVPRLTSSHARVPRRRRPRPRSRRASPTSCSRAGAADLAPLGRNAEPTEGSK